LIDVVQPLTECSNNWIYLLQKIRPVMQKFIRTVIYLSALVSSALGSDCIGPINIVFVNNQPLCGQNEEFSNCGNLCEVTLENYGEALTDDPINHPEMCKPNCYCEMGYIRSANGECVEDGNAEHKCESSKLLMTFVCQLSSPSSLQQSE
jgi:Trypsin Inhibitor like cysteine rich domain